MLSSCSSSLRFSSSFCFTVFSSFLNPNHERNHHHPISSSALSTLVVASFSATEAFPSSFILEIVFVDTLETTLVRGGFVDVLPNVSVCFEMIFGIE
jgi:hypothetical protein